MVDYMSVTLKVVGGLPELLEFLRVCGAIQWCGYNGSNRDIPVSCDGDGSGRMRFYVLEDGKEVQIPHVPEEQWGDGNLSIGE